MEAKSLMLCHLARCGDAGNSIIPSWVPGLRTRGADGMNTGQRARRRMTNLALSTQAGSKRANSSSTFLFYSCLSRLDNAHLNWGGQSTFLSPPISNANSEIPSQMHPEIIFNPVKLTLSNSHKINHRYQHTKVWGLSGQGLGSDFTYKSRLFFVGLVRGVKCCHRESS